MAFDDLKHAQRERLIFLDRCLTWRGTANRQDLMAQFGISSAQAALDFRLYLERAKKAPPSYDPARKTYIAGHDHKPLAPSTLTEAFESVLTPTYITAALPQPQPRAEPSIISRLYQAMKATRALHIRYTSMTSGADDGQWVAPTQFTSDGESVHIRAFSFKHEEYRNYLPIRISSDSTFDTRTVSKPLPWDLEWHTRAKIWLKPKAGLSREQAAVVRREYGFEGEFLCVETRKALEFYFDRRWGIGQRGARLERVKTDYEKMEREDGA